MARIYVASSWRNPHQPLIVEMLRQDGHEVYDFRKPFNGVPGFAWSEIDPEWQGWSAARYRELLTTHPIASRGFVSDLRAMQWADTCLLVLPSGRSAHLEAGWFCGQGKRCIILTQDGEEPELMALLATDICISPIEVLELLSASPARRGGSKEPGIDPRWPGLYADAKARAEGRNLDGSTRREALPEAATADHVSAESPSASEATLKDAPHASTADDRSRHYDRDGYCDNPARGY